MTMTNDSGSGDDNAHQIGRVVEEICCEQGDIVPIPAALVLIPSASAFEEEEAVVEEICEDEQIAPIPVEQIAGALEEDEAVAMTMVDCAEEHRHTSSTMTTVFSSSDNEMSSAHRLSKKLLGVAETERKSELDRLDRNSFSDCDNLEPMTHPMITVSSFSSTDDIELAAASREREHPSSITSHPPPPLIEATLVDEVIYDAVAFQPYFSKRHLQYALCGVLFILVVIVVVVVTASFVVPSVRNREWNFTTQSEEKRASSEFDVPTPPINVPHKLGDCFANHTELMTAIHEFDNQDCANDAGCEVGQQYGWPMNAWCVSRVQNMSQLFYGRGNFNHDISNWDVSSVTDMSEMFREAVAFNGNLSSWNVSAVTNMHGMFWDAIVYDDDLSHWDVSSVTDMSDMFDNAFEFSSDISKWNVSSVSDMYWMFAGALTFNSDLSTWDVRKVTNMSGMFTWAVKFNNDLSSWDVSSVTSMDRMFENAVAFNDYLSSWDISAVTNMSRMFNSADSFNQDLCDWADTFPYFFSVDIFNDSGCTYKSAPILDQRAPFCASSTCENDTR